MDEQKYQQQSVYQQQQMYQQPNWMPINDQEEPKQWLAITSFVLSLVGFNLLWLIFWIIALKKKQLRWAALAWTIISAAKLVITIFLLMWIFAGAILPRLWVAQQRARDIARESDLANISIAFVSYNLNNQRLSESKYWCTRDIINDLWWNPTIDDPLTTPFQPWLFCNSDKLWYWYWTNWTNFVVSASVEYPNSANLCKTTNKDFVSDFKNALNKNDLDTASDILKNIWDSCTVTDASNLYYVILY